MRCYTPLFVFFLILRCFSITTCESNAGRVFGAVEVKPKFKYPFAVRIWAVSRLQTKNTTKCGGTILNRNWILTAAHCVTGNGDFLHFSVGDHNVYEDEENEQELRPKQIIIHEKFKPYTQDLSGNYDIAVVQVEPPIRFSKFVSPINIPSCKQKPSYPEVTAIGWGESDEPRFTSKLMEGPLRLVPFEECRVPNKTIKYQLCTRNVNDTNAGHGDSGGPLFQLREKGNPHSGYVQLGITNWKGEGEVPNHYVYWADAAAYAGWIHRRISGCGNHPFSKLLTNNTIPTFATKSTR